MRLKRHPDINRRWGARRHAVCSVMLAHVSSPPKYSSFFLVVYANMQAAALMSECPQCGSIASYCIELVWRQNRVHCGECRYLMRLAVTDFVSLREQLVKAESRIERLMQQT